MLIDNELYNFTVIMEQVHHPDGVKSFHQVRCTLEQAYKLEGSVFRENPSCIIIEMRLDE